MMRPSTSCNWTRSTGTRASPSSRWTFEEPDQQGNLAREHAFVKQYGVKYTYLIAGAPEEMWEKVPQLVNLNTWPATVFIGRDGTIRGVHSGFASPASGEFNDQLKHEFTSRIETLLAEKATAQSATAAATAHRAGNGSGGASQLKLRHCRDRHKGRRWKHLRPFYIRRYSSRALCTAT